MFDPIGLISPFTIRAKMILLEIWKRRLKWDERLPPDLAKTYQDWCEELQYLNKVTLPRHLFELKENDELTKWQLHCFVDASKTVYGAVIYLRYGDLVGNSCSVLVASKSRVALVHEITIPRLEFLAPVVGARLFQYIRNNLELPKDTKFCFWSDSTIVLHLIKGNSRKLKVFVKNRVEEIRTISNSDWWNHCSGKENPADLLSRRDNLVALKNKELWWNGSHWIRKDADHWPQSSNETSDSFEAECEIENAITFFSRN
ncbi:uncharacterized protein LOC118187723 [Stegodyphus dumicola]|uniref:uncharacterized protein LOC118187723 n=1 Tax=Stegodyphus dumicola TaxID=202533 RepID=UPI0015AE6B35|nr:uncharacterized protein LOC118187723 [Stegodyphus dumicola]